jgi:OOP family OmpA-OmpF porin
MATTLATPLSAAALASALLLAAPVALAQTSTSGTTTGTTTTGTAGGTSTGGGTSTAGTTSSSSSNPMSSMMMTDETSGFYAGLGFGRHDPNDADPNSVWKIYGGWQLNRWLSAELGYVNFGNSGYGATAPNGTAYRSDFDAWGISAEAVAQFPIPIGALDRFSVLGKIGTIYYNRDDNGPYGRFNDDGWGFAWGAGVQYTFSERVGVRAEWERFQGIQTDMWTVSLNYKF